MALAAASPFASFDVTDGAQQRDISPVLQDAIFYDLNILSALNVDFGNPVFDTTHYWNEEALQADTVTVSGSVASTGTSVVLVAGNGARAHLGDLLYDTAANSTEVMQITSVSTDTLTVTRTYNSTVAASIADAAVLALIRSEQEGSDIGADKTLGPTVRNNYTQIFAGAYDLLVTGSQIARKMATNEYQDFVARQLQARANEVKIGLSRAVLYSEKSSSAGSDSVYRTMNGLRAWIRDNSGVVNTTSSAANYALLNLVNKSVVDLGVMPNLLLIGTDLVGSIAGIDSGNRRMLESDQKSGYAVQQIMLNQTNMVDVVIDPRVKPGDFFLIDKSRFSARPLNGRALFVIAATDFVDGKKRRILGEWTCEVRNPQAGAYARNKT
jgi:hypothetical protein